MSCSPSPFRVLQSDSKVRITLDGVQTDVPADGSLAAALLAAGARRTRTTPVSGAPRGPYCMMGICFECLVEIDGRPNRQACLMQVEAGMNVRTQDGARVVRLEEASDEL